MRPPLRIGRVVVFGAGIAVGFLAGYLIRNANFVVGNIEAADALALVLSTSAVLFAAIGFEFNVDRYIEERRLERPLFSLYDMSVEAPRQYSSAQDVTIQMVFHFRNIGRRSAEQIWIRSVRAHATIDSDETSVANRVDANGTIRKIVHIPAYVVDSEVFAGNFEAEPTARTKEVGLYLCVAYVDSANGEPHTDEFWVNYLTDDDYLTHGTLQKKQRLLPSVSRQKWEGDE